MKKSLMKRIIWLVSFCMIMSVFSGCGKDKTIKKAEEFIHLLINCDTYLNTNEEQVKDKLMPYLTEDAYKIYEENNFIYTYPTVFNGYSAKSIEINKIKCKNKLDNQYTFEVKYTIHSDSMKKKMTDYIFIEINDEGQYSQVILMNTSDVVKETYFAVEVH